MKKLSIAFILVLSISLSSFAGKPADDIPAFKGVQNFMQTFPQATEVECKNKGEFTEVSFIWNGLKLQAFYDLDGNPVATSRPVTIDNLPLTAQIKLREQYPGFIARAAIEFDDTNNGLSYYVTVTSVKTAYVLHISGDGNISVFKKMRN